MKDKIIIRVKDQEGFYDQLGDLLGEDTTSLLKGYLADNSGCINKAWFTLLLDKTNTLYDGIYKTREVAEALFEFLTKDTYKAVCVDMFYFPDMFGQELECGTDLASVFDGVGLEHSSQEDSDLLPIAKKEFKGGVFRASNGIWLCLWKDLSYVRYV